MSFSHDPNSQDFPVPPMDGNFKPYTPDSNKGFIGAILAIGAILFLILALLVGTFIVIKVATTPPVDETDLKSMITKAGGTPTVSSPASDYIGVNFKFSKNINATHEALEQEVLNGKWSISKAKSCSTGEIKGSQLTFEAIECVSDYEYTGKLGPKHTMSIHTVQAVQNPDFTSGTLSYTK